VDSIDSGTILGCFFALLATSFIADTYFMIIGMRKLRGKLSDLMMLPVLLCLPYFILLMWGEEQLTRNERIVDSIIALFCIISGVVNILVLRKKRQRIE
jgi:hypothetical protein